MSLLDMGGKRARLVSTAAGASWKVGEELRRERASREALLDTIQQLAAALERPGPHIARQFTNLRLAYAQHVYKAQGRTVERAFVLTGGRLASRSSRSMAKAKYSTCTTTSKVRHEC
jgi:hypothetical protein